MRFLFLFVVVCIVSPRHSLQFFFWCSYFVSHRDRVVGSG